MNPVCLIVDDDENCRLVAEEVARSCGFKVNKALNGLHALELCKIKMPDIIILDWMMPQMSGIEFLEKIRFVIAEKYPKIVMCSARYSKEDVTRGFAIGADEYLRKPVRIRDMTGALNSLCSKEIG